SVIKFLITDGKQIVADNAKAIGAEAQVSETITAESTVELDETSQEIVDILEEYVKPAVASDGGNIMFQSYDTDSKTVNVILQGACSGCPSSTFTLKNGIETMLKNMMGDKVNEVVALNG
ncbi:NifU family protein, partial [Maribacter dokdonensis]|uniref:NifU family protein n=1 Tax=Maribacter dokdonensis TaxID=320912 RepID=UPI0032974600